jgi:uncharacterized protein (DUF1778 family)
MMLNTAARFDLMLETRDKHMLSQAAAISGQTMASFVRTAALGRARDVIEQESRITLSRTDFDAFSVALGQAFTPNEALQEALIASQKVKRA